MTKTTSSITKLNDLSRAVEAARKKVQDESKDAFREACGEIFDAHPKLESFSWTQYAPYFNDGDACTFDVHELCGLVYDGVTFDGYDLGVRESRYVKTGTKEVPDRMWGGGRMRTEAVYEEQKLPAPELYCEGDDGPEIPDGFDMPGAIAAFEALEPVHSFMQRNEDIAESAFGNHVKVTVSRSGVETEKYSHD